MPIHDWTRVPAGLFHHFHQQWSIDVARRLNRGLLPPGVSALVEQHSGPLESDVLAVESRRRTRRQQPDPSGGVVTLDPPTAPLTYRSRKQIYAARANRVVIKHHLGKTVAVIEIVSPGNKDSKAAIRDFVDKTIEFFRGGIHVLVVDLFPPSPRDPLGVHQLIWDEVGSDPFAFPPGKDRIAASYDAGEEKVAYVQPLAVGDAIPDMPLFLAAGMHVKVPLEPTYLGAWEDCPEDLRTAVETGVLPDPDAE